MKIKLLLLSAIIALATTAASADSDHRYKDQRNQTFGHVKHHDQRAVDRHRLFSFSLIVPGPSHYMPHRYNSHHDYRNDYKHHNNKHDNRNGKHHDRDNLHAFRTTR
jgi:hypothetical protein